jgi:hypothetical protein
MLQARWSQLGISSRSSERHLVDARIAQRDGAADPDALALMPLP